MSRQKVGKYLAYAFGEIILVVIGILIAIGINQKQQEKENAEQLKLILSRVASDLQKDIVEIDSVLTTYKSIEEVTDKMLYGATANKDYLKKCKPCKFVLTGYDGPDLNFTGRELLKNYDKSLDDKQQLVENIEQFYLRHLGDISINDEFMIEQVKDFFKYLRSNKEWFTDFFVHGICDTNCEDYFSSYEYINRIAIINNLVADGHSNYLLDYKADAMKLRDEIKQFL